VAFGVLDWIATFTAHIPNKGEQLVRYYGYYSNVSRGKRRKEKPQQNRRTESDRTEESVCHRSGAENDSRALSHGIRGKAVAVELRAGQNPQSAGVTSARESLVSDLPIPAYANNASLTRLPPS
jgi:hypothetical protein